MDVLLFDAMNLIRRIYAPQHDKPDAIENTILLSQNALLKDIERFEPVHVACVFDGREETWRHVLYPDYKHKRKPMPVELADALHLFEQRFEQLGIACLHYPDLEADDVIATLTVKCQHHGKQVGIVSTDKGYMQIMDSNTIIYHHFDRKILSNDDVVSVLGFPSARLVDFLSLVGDTTNDIPGIDGIGPKTAGKLLDQYGDLDGILIHSNEIQGKPGEQLQQHYRQALLARKLVTLKVDCDLGVNLKQLRYKPKVYKPMASQG